MLLSSPSSLLVYQDDITRSFAFFYNPDFKPFEDGWTAFQPEEEFSTLIHSVDSDWRLTTVNKEYGVIELKGK